MEEQPPIYRDLWKEYKMVMDKMKKPPKLFGKVSLEDIIAHLRLITHDMVEFEQFEELAQVYRSMADIFGKLGKQIDQKNFYLKSARTYFKLLKNRSEMKFSLYTDLGDSMEENYLKAIELALKMNLIKLGALTFAEMAECFHFLKKYEFAHRYYLKAARILQTDFFLELSIFKKIIINANFYKNLDEPICDLFSLWQPFVRKFPKKETEEPYPPSAPEERIRGSLMRFEINFILISLKRYLMQDELGKSILDLYDENFRLNLRTSILNRNEFLKMSEFVKAVKLRRKHEVYHIYLIFLKEIVDDLGRKLFKEIYSFLDEIRTVREDFRKIMDDKTLSAKERIKKLYEEHTMNKRENVPSLEDDQFISSPSRNPSKAKRLKELREKQKQILVEKSTEI